MKKKELYLYYRVRTHKKKGAMIHPAKHHILKAAHPSPFAADKGFFGCKHFSKANAYLRDQGKQEIDW